MRERLSKTLARKSFTPKGVVSTESFLTVFFMLLVKLEHFPPRWTRTGSSVSGTVHYGIDAETGQWVAKPAPMHRTARGSDTPTGRICEGQASRRRARSVHLEAAIKKYSVSKSKISNYPQRVFFSF